MKNNHQFQPLEGKYVNLREVRMDDAAFILSLRCDPKKSRFLHETENNLEKQIAYLEHYFTLDNEWYFIIENKKHESLGTLGIYDVQGSQYTPGSWLMKDGSLPEESLEGLLLSRQVSFEILGLKKSCFDVRKGNKKVVRFHKMWGARIVAEDEIDYFFELTDECYYKNKQYFQDML